MHLSTAQRLMSMVIQFIEAVGCEFLQSEFGAEVTEGSVELEVTGTDHQGVRHGRFDRPSWARSLTAKSSFDLGRGADFASPIAGG